MRNPDFGPVEIIDFPATAVAALMHCGDPATLGVSIQQFIAWRKQHALPPSRSATFNVFYDNPETTAPEQFRLGLCAATTQTIDPNPQGVTAQVLPAGRCARLRLIGPDELLSNAARYLYLDWLAASGEELRDFPLFAQRITLFPDVPEHEVITDLFLPLR